MKPGLKKIVALILASVTLFGSGASVVSAAYADDTTMGRPTRIQAEPDVKTTTGGEAATKPDTGSGDEAGTDTQNQPDDASPQADAGQAAPDVTIHDMLDTDSATVSRLRLTDRITGTAPFDKDNARGDDKDETNDIVRSYDTVTYDYEYTLTPDSTMDYYRRTRVGFRFELPYPKDKVTFATDQMQWVDHTPGYEPKLTTETINGTVTQVYTCYRLLEPTSQTPTVNPGTSAISLAVAVKGAPHGYRFHPTVKAWPAWDASNPTNTGTHPQAVDTPADVTVSAKLNLNVSLKAYTVGGGVYDFGTGDASAPNKTQGKVSGRQLHVGAMVSMRWPDRSKGLKGIEVPRGRISYKLHVKNVFRDDDAGHTKHAGERKWQPLLWDRLHDDYSSSHVRAVDSFDHSTWWFPFSTTSGTVDEQSVLDGNVSYDEGTTDDDGTTIEVSFDGYDAANYPCRNTWDDKGVCSTDYMDSTGTVQQVAPLHVDNFVFILPTTRDGKTAAQYYGKGQTGIVSAYDYSLTADTESGYSLPASKDNGNQTVTNDDSTTFDYPVLLPGVFHQALYYTSCASTNCGRTDASTTGRWQDPEREQGSDRVLAGKSIGIMSSTENNLGTVGDGRVIGYHLMKWDPTVMTPLAAESNPSKPYMVKLGWSSWGARWSSSDTMDGNSSAPVVWGVRPDGGNFPDDKSQAKASYEDFDWYDTYAEAAKHGLVLAATVCDTRVWDSARTTLGQRLAFGLTLPVRIKDTAVGRTAQITGQVDFWTRSKLAKTNGLDADSDDIAPWVSFVSKVGRLRYRDFVEKYGEADLHCDGKNYVKATFSEDGIYQGGDTAGLVRGDTLYVVGEQPHVGKSTAQRGDDGTSAKTVYDLDKEQRYVDWVVTASAETQASSTGGDYVTDYHIKDTLPAGLTYVDGSSYVGGTYAEHDHGQQRGTVTGGQSITPKISRNKDGTTTLEYVVNGAKADSSTKTRLHFTTVIGDASDPDNDAKNNQQYTNHVEIRSKRAMGEPRLALGQTADYTVRVSRTRASALATRADPLLNDIERPLGYRNMLGNFSKDEKTNPYAVDIMPYKGLNQSNYHGDYTLTGLTVKAGAGASMNGVKVYFTTDQKWRNVDATKITREQVRQWTEATVNATTGKVTIPDGYGKPVAWAFTSPSLPANARYDFILSIKPTGNSASDMYVNRWADGDNKVDAVTQVVERKVNGVAWFDLDHDGVREDTDRLLPDVNVTLVDADGRTVTSMNGRPCTTVTGRDGRYELTAVPAGTGFRLRFTPKTGTAWHGQHTTVKNAKEASEATDSDSDQENDSHGNMVAGVITLKPFPALDEMTSAVYEDPNEDHGMSGTLMPATPATFKAVKVLDGRPNGAWTDRDRYVADITALDGAPANAVPSTITFADNRTQTLQINSNAFAKEGVYRYQVKERKGDNAGVTYDSRTWILTVTVQDDLTTFTRRITANMTCDGVQSDAIQFTNTYHAKPVSVQFRAHKTLNDPDHTGIQLQAGQYEFTCVEDKTGGQVGTVKTNDQRGDVLFDTISYTKTGVYDYTLSEVQGDRGGITYDATKHHVKVTVTDNGEGQLLADVKYDDGTNIPEFTNTYHAQPATDNPTAVKKMTSSKGNKYTLKGEDFAFTLQQQSAPANVSNADQTKRNDRQGNIRFDQLSFPLVGTYVFTMSEQDTTVPGVTKDGTVATITYVVKDVDHTGKLAVVSKTVTPTTGANGKNITFTNHYSPKNVGYSISGVKNIVNTDTATSRVPQDGEFKFQLNAVSAHDSDGNAISMNDMPMPAGSQNGTVTVTNKGSGFTFGQMVYTMPGVYTYHVKELAGTDKTIGYSTQEYDVTVTVTDRDGMLSATVDRQATDVRFDNTYTPTPVGVTVKADKRLTGRDLNDGEFTAELKDSDGNLLQTKRFARVPRDAQSDKATDVREGEGTLEFDKLTFDRAGVYTYTVTEQDGNLGGVTYDRTVHTVTVTVTEDADSHTLTAKTEYSTENGSEDGIRFDNTYQPQNVLVELTARKRLTGRELKADEFEFELVDKTGKVIDTERNDKDGDIRFKPLTYGRDNNGIDDCGEHRYVIRERNTGEKNVTYDRTEHHVTVTVGDDLQGNLTAKVEYDPTDGKTKDSSATPTDKADKTKGDAVGDQPSAIPGMVTVNGTRPEFNNSYIPPATPAVVQTIRQLAKTGVSTPTVALAAFTLLGVGLTVAYSVRRRHAVTPRHGR